MVDQQYLHLLRQGVTVWNTWRTIHQVVQPDFTDADLRGVDLSEADLRGAILIKADLTGTILRKADLRRAILRGTRLTGARLTGADLRGAILTRANLVGTDLVGADLTGAILTEANLTGANLIETTLTGADMSDVRVGWTVFGNINLYPVKGLETVQHEGPSYVSTSTLTRSAGSIPETFLRGIGLDDTFISYMRSLIAHPIEHYTCCISYASKDRAFAERLYADLQNKGMRCWLTPHHRDSGEEMSASIDEPVRMYDKLLLVISEHSISSQWLVHGLEKARAKEAESPSTVLFPICLDNALPTCYTAWAEELRRTHRVRDFKRWKQHDAYMKALALLLRDLTAESTKVIR